MIKSESPITIKKEVQMVSPYIKIPDNINSFQFDSNDIKEGFILVNIAYFIFEDIVDKHKIQIDKKNLSNFISNVSLYYHNNFFHNFQHAINVLQMTWFLLNETNISFYFQPHIIFALLISALCHDIDHPGNTNSYEINSMSKRALIYNDISVLENHHCAVTFDLLLKCELNKYFNITEFKEIRKTIITCILSTDMIKHNELMADFFKFDMSKSNFTIDEQIFIAKILLHFSDLSNTIKKFDTSFKQKIYNLSKDLNIFKSSSSTITHYEIVTFIQLLQQNNLKINKRLSFLLLSVVSQSATINKLKENTVNINLNLLIKKIIDNLLN
jgi:hypothetical protein